MLSVDLRTVMSSNSSDGTTNEISVLALNPDGPNENALRGV